MSARQLRARLDRLTRSDRSAVGQDRAAITGDPEGIAPNVGDGALTQLLREPAERLVGELEKEHLVSLIVANRMARERCIKGETPSTELGKLGLASGRTLLANANAAKVRQSTSQAPSVQPGDNAKVTEGKAELDPAWDAWKKEVRETMAAA